MSFRYRYWALFILNVFVLIGFAGIMYRQNIQRDVYVDNKKLFENFKMTHDLKVRGDKQFDLRSRTIDSLYTMLNDPASSSVKDIIVQRIRYEEESLEKFSQVYTTDESSKIWARIHSYANEFAARQNYRFIFGAQPDYNILYGEEDSNKTDEFLKFINERYDGHK